MERQRSLGLNQLDLPALDPEPCPPMDREVYNERGHLVAWVLRLVVRKWPSVFWNEVAHARDDATRIDEPRTTASL